MLRLLIRRPSVLPSADADVGVVGDDGTLASSKPVGDTTRSEADSKESTDGLEPASDCDCDAVRDRSDDIRSDVDVLVELALDVGRTADRL